MGDDLRVKTIFQLRRIFFLFPSILQQNHRLNTTMYTLSYKNEYVSDFMRWILR